MDAQTAINIAFGLAGVLGGWVLKFLHGAMRDLQHADMELTDKVQRIEVLVAGQYVKRDDMEKLSNALFHKLDRIEQKLDAKVDKP